MSERVRQETASERAKTASEQRRSAAQRSTNDLDHNDLDLGANNNRHARLVYCREEQRV